VSIAKPIRVLHVIRQGLIGGGESHVLTLVDKLDDNTVSSYVMSFTDGPMVQQLRAMNVPVNVIPIKNSLDWRLYTAVRKFLVEEQIDLIHAHGSRACAFIIILARLLKIKVIYTIHGWSFHPDQSPWVKLIRRTAERIITGLTAKNICVSDSNLQTGQQLYSAFKAEVVRYGIDLKRFSPENSYQDYRKEWDVPADGIVILFAARMTIQKQPLVVLKAFEIAALSNPRLYLVMAGSGELLAEVHANLNEMTCKTRVRMRPFYADMPGVLKSADIVVLPSLWEGLPIALLEAMAMSKVILATAVDGTKELIETGKNGILINVSKSMDNDLAGAILNVSQHDFLFQKLSANARETVLKIYNAEVMAGHMLGVYNTCLNKE
jgi:glycosyltransferase involved in cell wall biosynthesis